MELVILGVFLLGYVASLRTIGKDHFASRAHGYGQCQKPGDLTRSKCEARHGTGCWKPQVYPRDVWDGVAILGKTLIWPAVLIPKVVLKIIPETGLERDAWIDFRERELDMNDELPSVGKHPGPPPEDDPDESTWHPTPFWIGKQGETLEFTYEQGRPPRTVWLRLSSGVHPGTKVKIGPLEVGAEVYLVRPDARLRRRRD